MNQLLTKRKLFDFKQMKKLLTLWKSVQKVNIILKWNEKFYNFLNKVKIVHFNINRHSTLWCHQAASDVILAVYDVILGFFKTMMTESPLKNIFEMNLFKKSSHVKVFIIWIHSKTRIKFIWILFLGFLLILFTNKYVQSKNFKYIKKVQYSQN